VTIGEQLRRGAILYLKSKGVKVTLTRSSPSGKDRNRETATSFVRICGQCRRTSGCDSAYVDVAAREQARAQTASDLQPHCGRSKSTATIEMGEPCQRPSTRRPPAPWSTPSPASRRQRVRTAAVAAHYCTRWRPPSQARVRSFVSYRVHLIRIGTWVTISRVDALHSIDCESAAARADDRQRCAARRGPGVDRKQQRRRHRPFAPIDIREVSILPNCNVRSGADGPVRFTNINEGTRSTTTTLQYNSCQGFVEPEPPTNFRAETVQITGVVDLKSAGCLQSSGG
jgi:hypothetical protein